MSEQDVPTKVGTVVYVDLSDGDRAAYILGEHGVFYPIDIARRYLSSFRLRQHDWEAA